jgi:hypothetical protein
LYYIFVITGLLDYVDLIVKIRFDLMIRISDLYNIPIWVKPDLNNRHVTRSSTYVCEVRFEGKETWIVSLATYDMLMVVSESVALKYGTDLVHA